MCGIVGGIAERNLVPILLEGLRRLEYRGYDSSGIAVQNEGNNLKRIRSLGKIKNLQNKIDQDTESLSGSLAIAHTRWATHGVPSENNAHPHISNNSVAVVHNGIIENYQSLKENQQKQGYTFASETDTEVVAHAIHAHAAIDNDLFTAVQHAIQEFQGAYAIGVISNDDPDTLIAARKGSPLVIGLGIGENFIASDMMALLPVTRKFSFLEEGDVAEVTRFKVNIFDVNGESVEREAKEASES